MRPQCLAFLIVACAAGSGKPPDSVPPPLRPNEVSVETLNAFPTPAQRRMIFEEFFLFQVGHAWRRHATSAELKPHTLTVDDRIRASAAKVLPFKLTPGQRAATKEIVDDMMRPEPMHRLLQGDVGAGKTIVALLAAVVAMENGLQVAFMAPTEVLARQHHATLRRLCAGTDVPWHTVHIWMFLRRSRSASALTKRSAGMHGSTVMRAWAV